jgi:hypothetical protein
MGRYYRVVDGVVVDYYDTTSDQPAAEALRHWKDDEGCVVLVVCGQKANEFEMLTHIPIGVDCE